MNILYIGPYRQQSIIGIHSQILLLNLLNDKNNTITARPVYTDFNKPPVKELHNDIVKAEQNSCDSYDTIIQNVPLNMASPIHGIKSNILIPVLSVKNITEDEISTMSHFNKILVDNKNDYKILSSHKSIASKIHTYDYSFSVGIGPNASVDLGMFNNSNKLYFIGEYSENATNIISICKAFVSSSMIDDFVFCIFLLYPNNNDIQELERNIKNIYAENKKINTINRIIIGPLEMDIQHIAVIHKTCDAFIDLQDDNSNSINVKLSQSHDSKIISFDINDYTFSFDRNSKSSPIGYFSPSESSINISIKKYLKFKTSTEIVPSKKTPINKII
jgi:hypothetical protein